MITAIIVEDEVAMQEVNKKLLDENFGNIQLLGVANSVVSGVELIQKSKPDLVLLDVVLPDGSAFKLLQQLSPYHFKVVFITGHDDYAIKAIKFSAIDYILKPVNETEFCQAINSALQQIDEHSQEQYSCLLSQYSSTQKPQKIVLKTASTTYVVTITDVLYCKSDNSYTTFFMKDGSKILVSKNIKEFTNLFADCFFMRVHRSYLVNLQNIIRVDKANGGFVVMKNNEEIPISPRQKNLLIAQLEKL